LIFKKEELDFKEKLKCVYIFHFKLPPHPLEGGGRIKQCPGYKQCPGDVKRIKGKRKWIYLKEHY